MKTIDDIKRERNVPAIVADHRGVITYVNERFEQAFGWRTREIVGQPLTTIIPGGMHDAHHLGFSRFLTTGKPTLLDQPLMLKAVAKDGTEIDAEHRIIAERLDGQWVFGATLRPLSEN